MKYKVYNMIDIINLYSKMTATVKWWAHPVLKVANFCDIANRNLSITFLSKCGVYAVSSTSVFSSPPNLQQLPFYISVNSTFLDSTYVWYHGKWYHVCHHKP